jgi:probable rRNA maturation factor
MPRSSSNRPIRLYNGHPRLVLPRSVLVAAVRALDRAASAPPPAARRSARQVPHPAEPLPWTPPPAGELSIAFLTDAAQARLHAQFLDDPTPTDVITFPGDPAAGLAGEICVSVDTARNYALRHDRSFARELLLYVVHGYLHLSGLDDTTPVARRTMRAAERAALAHLEQVGHLPEFRLK